MEKINYTVLDNLNDYKNLKIDKTDLVICRQPLFHGTTRLALDNPGLMEEINRHSFIILNAARDYFYQHYEDPKFNEDLDNYYKKSRNYIFCDDVTRSIGDVHNYSYGDFYLSTNILVALEFTLIPSGELGRRAFYNAKGLMELNIDLGIKESIDFIVDIQQKFEESERVILYINNVDFEDMYTESGNPLIFIDKDGNKSYDACEDVYLSEVSEHMATNYNYRLKNLHKYSFKLIKKELFRESIGYFTNIRDVEDYLSTPSRDNYRITNAERYKI